MHVLTTRFVIVELRRAHFAKTKRQCQYTIKILKQNACGVVQNTGYTLKLDTTHDYDSSPKNNNRRELLRTVAPETKFINRTPLL